MRKKGKQSGQTTRVYPKILFLLVTLITYFFNLLNLEGKGTMFFTLAKALLEVLTESKTVIYRLTSVI